MLLIRPLGTDAHEIEKLKEFTDREIGVDYYSDSELKDIAQRSRLGGMMHSLVLVDREDRILGIRMTFPPGAWSSGKGRGLSPHLWPHRPDQTAYFQSLFLAVEIQGQGWGGKLSQTAIERLKSCGTLGIVCHSWKESPNNSSFRYLNKLGFKLVAEFTDYWSQISYHCTRCLAPPCRCTAQEMYLQLV